MDTKGQEQYIEKEYNRLESVFENEIEETNIELKDLFKRYNVLLTSICGGALFLIFQILREIKLKEITNLNKNALFISGILFMMAIFLNLIIPKLIILIITRNQVTIQNQLNKIHNWKMDKRYEKFNINDSDKFSNLNDDKKAKQSEHLIKIIYIIDLIIMGCMLFGILLIGVFFYNYIFQI